VLRKIVGPKGEEVAGNWKRLHYEELRNLNASPNLIRVKKLWRVRLARHVARMGEMGNARFWLENLKGMGHSEDLGVDGKVTLE
jgi:hypothetical protein